MNSLEFPDFVAEWIAAFVLIKSKSKLIQQLIIAKVIPQWANESSRWRQANSLSTRKRSLRSHLVLEHGTRVRFLMGTNVIIPFFQVPTPEFGHQAREKPCTLVLNRALIYWITQCLSTAPFCAGAAALVLGYQVWRQPSKSHFDFPTSLGYVRGYSARFLDQSKIRSE